MSEHFGCSVELETLRFRMTDISNISHQSLISVDSRPLALSKRKK